MPLRPTSCRDKTQQVRGRHPTSKGEITPFSTCLRKRKASQETSGPFSRHSTLSYPGLSGASPQESSRDEPSSPLSSRPAASCIRAQRRSLGRAAPRAAFPRQQTAAGRKPGARASRLGGTRLGTPRGPGEGQAPAQRLLPPSQEPTAPPPQLPAPGSTRGPRLTLARGGSPRPPT